MVKTKKIFAITIAVVTVLFMTVAANAASSGVGTRSFSGARYKAYTARGTFTVTATMASATMYMQQGSGEATTDPFCSLLGGVFDSNGNIIAIVSGKGEFSCSGSSSYSGTAAKSICTYYIVGEEVKTLTIPEEL